MKIVAGFALAVLVVGCGGAQPLPGKQDKRNEILSLWTQIRGWRGEAKMNLDPPTQMIAVVGRLNVKDVKQKTCREGQNEPQQCSDICSIADNICDNAERICTLAEELGKQDDFAQEKCSSAKASCKEAKQRCCGCSETPL
ncbi:MAG TPA: hypothetical protein VGM90_36210 [Kofleriaceae bacterium]